MRFIYLLILVIITVLEIGPIPITPLILIWVVVFRPSWFYDLVRHLYNKN